VLGPRLARDLDLVVRAGCFAGMLVEAETLRLAGLESLALWWEVSERAVVAIIVYEALRPCLTPLYLDLVLLVAAALA